MTLNEHQVVRLYFRLLAHWEIPVRNPVQCPRIHTPTSQQYFPIAL